MVLRKFIATIWICAIVGGGCLIGKTMINDYRKMQQYDHEKRMRNHETIPTPGLWTPANEELPLPDVDMKDSRELLPRKIDYGYIFQEIKLATANHDGLQLEEHEIEIIKYTNEYRVRNGKRPLKASRKLMGTSRLQAWHQTRRGMSHGYTRGWSGENIAAGQQSPREAVNAWINSSGHRANMLGNWNYIGVGGYSNQWAQQFE